MDGNRDESERCILIAQRKMRDGQFDQAVKFLKKADRLYPSPVAQDLMQQLETLLNARTASDQTEENGDADVPFANGSAAGASSAGDSETAYRRKGSAPSPADTNSHSDRKSRTASPAVEFTAEQVEAVRRIKKCKDYYEILGLEKDVADVEIKKAYKKLALQFHPDKNSAPGADEAFKMIGNAAAVLSDPQKRKQYDMYGSEEQMRSNVRSYERHYANDYTRGFEAEISPEDLFNMFFGGGNLYAGTQFRRQRFTRHHMAQDTTHETAGGFGVLLQMMPVLILITLSVMSSFFVSEPAYSLVRNNKFMHPRKTSNLEVPYFVKENFEKEYKGNIRRIEAQVEEDFINNLRSSCYRESNYRDNMIWRAHHFRDRAMEEKAKSLKTPSCDRLQKMSLLV